MFGGSYAPDKVVDGVIFLWRNLWTIRNGRWSQTNRVWEIQQRRGADKVCAFSRQDTQRLWEEYIVAGCQSDAAYRCVEGWLSHIAWAGRLTILLCQVEFTIGAIDAFRVNQQNCIVVPEM